MCMRGFSNLEEKVSILGTDKHKNKIKEVKNYLYTSKQIRLKFFIGVINYFQVNHIKTLGHLVNGYRNLVNNTKHLVQALCLIKITHPHMMQLWLLGLEIQGGGPIQVDDPA